MDLWTLQALDLTLQISLSNFTSSVEGLEVEKRKEDPEDKYNLRGGFQIEHTEGQNSFTATQDCLQLENFNTCFAHTKWFVRLLEL